MPQTIIIFEDNAPLRQSLSYLINQTSNFVVIGDFDNCVDAYELTKKLQPNIVFMDIDMPQVNGIVGVAQVKKANPNTAVIVYTVFEDNDTLFNCLCAGANGYILKKTPPEKLFDAIHEVLAGGAPMSPSIAKKVISSFYKKESSSEKLTKREQEVLHLLADGYSIKMIASKLEISFDTVRSHLKNVYQKLHVSSGKEAIAKAFREKML